MRFKFIIKDYDGFSHKVEKVFTSIDAAIEGANRLEMGVNFVESVTLYSMLTDDSCGPIKYIGEYRYGDL